MLAHAATVAAIFGVTPVLNKYILQTISVEQLIVMSGLLFGITAVIYGSVRGLWPSLQSVGYPSWTLVAISSTLIFFVANYLYLRAITNGKTYVVAGITATYPLITALCGYLVFREALTFRHLVGLGLIIGGVVALT